MVGVVEGVGVGYVGCGDDVVEGEVSGFGDEGVGFVVKDVVVGDGEVGKEGGLVDVGKVEFEGCGVVGVEVYCDVVVL